MVDHFNRDQPAFRRLERPALRRVQRRPRRLVDFRL